MDGQTNVGPPGKPTDAEDDTISSEYIFRSGWSQKPFEFQTETICQRFSPEDLLKMAVGKPHASIKNRQIPAFHVHMGSRRA